jgi:hypothetical protein
MYTHPASPDCAILSAASSLCGRSHDDTLAFFSQSSVLSRQTPAAGVCRPLPAQGGLRSGRQGRALEAGRDERALRASRTRELPAPPADAPWIMRLINRPCLLFKANLLALLA